MGEDKERLKGTRKIKGGLNDRQRKKRSRNALDYERSSTESRAKGREEACEEADKESRVAMELIIIAVLAVMLPIMSVTFFIIGYNINASKRIFVPHKKRKPTKDEIMLERIDKATV